MLQSQRQLQLRPGGKSHLRTEANLVDLLLLLLLTIRGISRKARSCSVEVRSVTRCTLRKEGCGPGSEPPARTWECGGRSQFLTYLHAVTGPGRRRELVSDVRKRRRGCGRSWGNVGSATRKGYLPHMEVIAYSNVHPSHLSSECGVLSSWRGAAYWVRIC